MANTRQRLIELKLRADASDSTDPSLTQLRADIDGAVKEHPKNPPEQLVEELEERFTAIEATDEANRAIGVITGSPHEVMEETQTHARKWTRKDTHPPAPAPHKSKEQSIKVPSVGPKRGRPPKAVLLTTPLGVADPIPLRTFTSKEKIKNQMERLKVRADAIRESDDSIESIRADIEKQLRVGPTASGVETLNKKLSEYETQQSARRELREDKVAALEQSWRGRGRTAKPSTVTKASTSGTKGERAKSSSGRGREEEEVELSDISSDGSIGADTTISRPTVTKPSEERSKKTSATESHRQPPPHGKPPSSERPSKPSTSERPAKTPTSPREQLERLKRKVDAMDQTSEDVVRVGNRIRTLLKTSPTEQDVAYIEKRVSDLSSGAEVRVVARKTGSTQIPVSEQLHNDLLSMKERLDRISRNRSSTSDMCDMRRDIDQALTSEHTVEKVSALRDRLKALEIKMFTRSKSSGAPGYTPTVPESTPRNIPTGVPEHHPSSVEVLPPGAVDYATQSQLQELKNRIDAIDSTETSVLDFRRELRNAMKGKPTERQLKELNRQLRGIEYNESRYEEEGRKRKEREPLKSKKRHRSEEEERYEREREARGSKRARDESKKTSATETHRQPPPHGKPSTSERPAKPSTSERPAKTPASPRAQLENLKRKVDAMDQNVPEVVKIGNRIRALHKSSPTEQDVAYIERQVSDLASEYPPVSVQAPPPPSAIKYATRSQLQELKDRIDAIDSTETSVLDFRRELRNAMEGMATKSQFIELSRKLRDIEDNESRREEEVQKLKEREALKAKKRQEEERLEKEREAKEREAKEREAKSAKRARDESKRKMTSTIDIGPEVVSQPTHRQLLYLKEKVDAMDSTDSEVLEIRRVIESVMKTEQTRHVVEKLQKKVSELEARLKLKPVQPLRQERPELPFDQRIEEREQQLSSTSKKVKRKPSKESTTTASVAKPPAKPPATKASKKGVAKSGTGADKRMTTDISINIASSSSPSPPPAKPPPPPKKALAKSIEDFLMKPEAKSKLTTGADKSRDLAPSSKPTRPTLHPPARKPPVVPPPSTVPSARPPPLPKDQMHKDLLTLKGRAYKIEGSHSSVFKLRRDIEQALMSRQVSPGEVTALSNRLRDLEFLESTKNREMAERRAKLKALTTQKPPPAEGLRARLLKVRDRARAIDANDDLTLFTREEIEYTLKEYGIGRQPPENVVQDLEERVTEIENAIGRQSVVPLLPSHPPAPSTSSESSSDTELAAHIPEPQSKRKKDSSGVQWEKRMRIEKPPVPKAPPVSKAPPVPKAPPVSKAPPVPKAPPVIIAPPVPKAPPVLIAPPVPKAPPALIAPPVPKAPLIPAIPASPQSPTSSTQSELLEIPDEPSERLIYAREEWLKIKKQCKELAEKTDKSRSSCARAITSGATPEEIEPQMQRVFKYANRQSLIEQRVAGLPDPSGAATNEYIRLNDVYIKAEDYLKANPKDKHRARDRVYEARGAMLRFIERQAARGYTEGHFHRSITGRFNMSLEEFHLRRYAPERLEDYSVDELRQYIESSDEYIKRTAVEVQEIQTVLPYMKSVCWDIQLLLDEKMGVTTGGPQPASTPQSTRQHTPSSPSSSEEAFPLAK